MSVNLLYVALVFAVLNLRGYALMRRDKREAVRARVEERTSEADLLVAAALGGFVGVIAGMYVPTRHKTSKQLFRRLLPLIVIGEVALLYLGAERLAREGLIDFYYDDAPVRRLYAWAVETVARLREG